MGRMRRQLSLARDSEVVADKVAVAFVSQATHRSRCTVSRVLSVSPAVLRPDCPCWTTDANMLRSLRRHRLQDCHPCRRSRSVKAVSRRRANKADARFALLGKFSIRLVPDMTVDKVTELVCKYVEDEFAKIKTKNKMTVEMVHGGEPWVVSADSILTFQAPISDPFRSVRPTRTTTTTARPLVPPSKFTASSRLSPAKVAQSLSPCHLPTRSTSMCACCRWDVAMTVRIAPTRSWTRAITFR